MKKNLLLFISLLAISVFMEGCKKDPVAPDPSLSITPDSNILYEAAGGSTTITVTTNQEKWGVVSDQDWCAVAEIDETTFTVTAQANEGNDPMPQATVTVTAGTGKLKKEVKFKVDQRGIPAQFEIQLTDITSASAKMKVVPLDLKASYYYDLIALDVLKEYHSSDLAVLMKNTVDEAVSVHGSLAAALEAITNQGVAEYDYTRLAPETDYVAFAAGLDMDGEVNTEIIRKDFKTVAFLSEITFDIDFTNYYFDGADYTITPSAEDAPYYVTMRPAFRYQGLTDAQLLEQILLEDAWMIEPRSVTGVYEYENEGVWLTDTEYLVLVFGYAGGAPTTELIKFPFRTSEPNVAPADCTFAVTVTDITSRSANISIIPSDETSVYMFDLIAEADYEMYKSNMKQYVTEYVAQDIDNLDYNRDRGDSGYMYTKVLNPGTKYYVWTACINEFGKPAADVIISEPFLTLPNVISDATVSASVVNYFNGDDLYELDPEKYANGRGMAYVSVSFVPDKASVWYGTMVKEDPQEPTSAIPDDAIIKTLTEGGGTWCPTGKLYWAEWGKEYTLLAVAVGNDDNNSALFRQTNTFTKAGASPVSEFVEPTALAASSSATKSALSKFRYTPTVKMYREMDHKR